MKKLISLFGLLLIISTTMFTSCNPEAKPEPGKSDPIEKPSDTEKPELVTKEFTQQDFVIEPTSNPAWAYVTYSLSEFTGKDVTIDFSADMKVEGTKDCVLKWQVNRAPDYPVVAEYSFTSLDSDWIKVSGKNQEPINVENSFVLYLSSHEVPSADVKISVKNIKYTVTYGGSADEEPEVPAKEYPTDIFTVGEADTCGIQIGDGELKPFKIFTQDGASAVKTNLDGSVEWIATAAGGGGGGCSFYINEDKSEINMANYESIELEFVYSPLTGAWNPKASNPGFCLRILPWDSTGIFGGAIDLQYFDAKDEYGTYTGKIEIPADFADKVIASSSQDVVKAFALKFNDYERGNDKGDQVKVQLKKVKFNRKADAPADKPFDDGLTDEQRGTVKSIYYPTKDYAAINKGEEPTEYEKHAWVYLPAGYDAEDKDTKYPVFILIHGHGQNENTWGLTDQGNGGKIKGYMDRGMASGEYEKFILVCATGIASKNWGPNGAGTDMDGSNAFGGELRTDLLPYIRENYNVAEGRDNVALAGLSMGGGQTMNIGIGQCLDLISWFGAYSAAIFNTPQEYFPSVEKAFPDLDLNYLYMICGDADNLVIDGVRGVVNYINTTGWDKVGGKERFSYTEVPGGTHDFPVWFQGFDEFSRIIFKKK